METTMETTAEKTRNMTELEFAQVLKQALGEERWSVNCEGLSLDIGYSGWRWPGGHVIYGSEQNARLHVPSGAREEALAAGPQYFDDRLSILDVKRMVIRAEREAFMRTNDIPAADALAYAGGAWNEYLSSAWGVDDSEPWPNDCYMAVYVIPGGNEGLQLRVQTVNEEPRLLLYGKSLGIGWAECYESAGRISAMLNQ